MVDSIKELEKLIKMLRKNGVESAKVDGIELKLGSEPPPPSKYMAKKAAANAAGALEIEPPKTDEPTQEELLFWSSTPPGLQETPEQ